MKLKLNYKRTALIGFAFFGITLLWEVYDSWCSPFLTELLTNHGEKDALEVQGIVGLIMACDNIAALILLPIFGSLSDRTHTKIGKRMPYILTGTFVSAIAFPFIPFFFHHSNLAGLIVTMGIVLIFMMMYRNPAVSLMPDITPKPLRAKANGIINIMGYVGGAFTVLLGIFCSYTKYQKTQNLWTVEIPFLVASLLMVAAAFVLYNTIKENELEEELKEELEEGERLAAIETPVDDDKPMSHANKVMLFAILGAEVLWFMADNGLGTFLSNYVLYYLEADFSNKMFLTIAMGAGSLVGFSIAGSIADRIGRKWTVFTGLSITLVAYIFAIFIKPSSVVDEATNLHPFPMLLLVVWLFKGFGMSLVHNCSFPMVVELCSSKKIGKFTGFYYTASMGAQTLTPIILGQILERTQKWGVLPIYSALFILASDCVVFFFIKNIKADKVSNAKGLEALGGDD